MALDTAKAVGVLRSLTAKFDLGVTQARPFYPEVCTIIPSTGADEEYGAIGAMPGVREWLGDRIFNELRAAKYTLVNRDWEDSLLIKKNDIADDRLGLYPPLMERLGAEAAYHPDELFFSTLVAGESTACFDGQFFFDTDHVWGDSGTQDNDLAYDAASTSAVTATEFKAAYHAARRAMLKYKNDQGKLLNRPLSGSLRSLMILVPTELEVPAQEAVNSIIISNSTNIVLDSPRIVTSAHLTDATKWYLLNLDGPLKPMVFQAREPITRQTKGLDDIETKDVKFMTEARYNVGYLAWWQAVLTTFT